MAGLGVPWELVQAPKGRGTSEQLCLHKVFIGFPGSSVESACNVGDLDLISGLGRSSGEGKGYPLQYSGLENSMD